MDSQKRPGYNRADSHLPDDDDNARSRRGNGLTTALLGILAFLFIILLAAVVWLGFETHQCRRDIDDLRNSLQISSAHNYATVTNINATTSSITSEYPAVYLSQSSTTSYGYSYAGQLFRGSGYWATQLPLSTPRADFSLLNLNETVYYFGGHDENDKYLTDGFSYQPLLNVSANISSLPDARSHFAAGSIDNTSIILAGGYSSEANENSNIPENCSLIYNVTADSWASGPCLKQGRGSACGVAVAGNFFVVGGLGSTGTPLASIESYSPSNNSWTTFVQLPSARSDVGCAASGNNIIVAGGTSSSGGDLSEVYAIDATNGNMTRLGDMLNARFDLQLVALPTGDVLAVGGGQHVNNTEEGLHSTELYSVASDQWVEKAPMSDQRFAFGAVYANEGVYAAGGHLFCNDTLTEDCGNRVRDSVEVFYDSVHPDIFVHIQQPGTLLGSALGAGPNTSEVLLLSTSNALGGYQAAGSLYRGSGYWSLGQNLPQALSDLNVVGDGNSIYIIGGLDIEDGGEVVDTLYKYDAVLDQYTNLSSLPEPRTRGGADILGGLLYYVGGYTSSDESAVPVDTMLVYNISADTWMMSNATLSSPRSDLCVAAVDGVLYGAGGYSTNYTATLNLAEMYDPNVGAWVNITSMPTPRGDVMCSALNGEYVAAGGYYDPTNQFLPASFRTEVQAYSPATGDWRDLASLPVARGDAAMETVPSQFGDRLIVTGGESQVDNARTGIATHQVQEYSSALDTWILKAPMISPRFRHDIAYAEGHILIFGGASSSICADDGSGLEECVLEPVATVEEFFDTDNPDLFVYTAL